MTTTGTTAARTGPRRNMTPLVIPELPVDEEQGVPEHPSAEPDRDSANRA